MAYRLSPKRKLGWSPVPYAESKNIGIDLQDPKFNSSRKFYR